jgi:hypothetical protein
MPYDIGDLGGDGNGARRLLALADYLETVPERSYDHRTWRRQRPDGSWAMCALGHGVTALPAVIGLRWREPGSSDIVRIDGSGFTEDVLTLAAEAFGITEDEARMIFGVGLYTVAFYGASAVFGVKPKRVAATIRAYAVAKAARASAYPVGVRAA